MVQRLSTDLASSARHKSDSVMQPCWLKLYICSNNEKTSKEASITRFGRKSFVSDSALASIIAEIREHGLPDVGSRHSIARDKKAYINECTDFGNIITTCLAIGLGAKKC